MTPSSCNPEVGSFQARGHGTELAWTPMQYAGTHRQNLHGAFPAELRYGTCRMHISSPATPEQPAHLLSRQALTSSMGLGVGAGDSCGLFSMVTLLKFLNIKPMICRGHPKAAPAPTGSCPALRPRGRRRVPAWHLCLAKCHVVNSTSA